MRDIFSLNYIFVGNRCNVLKKMIEMKLSIAQIFAVKNSYLEKELYDLGLEFNILPPKEEFVEYLQENSFDILVSNGCPYILPISKLRENGRKSFINIHPSLLPDLKGKNPINGAILFNRKHGVTCHFMSDKIDDGDIISQLEIPISADIDLDLLYQISFLSEGLVFEKAVQREFNPVKRSTLDDTLYYSRTENDLYISSNDDIDSILRRVRAFSCKGQYARFIYHELIYKVIFASVISNAYICEMFERIPNNTIVLRVGENKILAKYQGKLIYLCLINSEGLLANTTWLN